MFSTEIERRHYPGRYQRFTHLEPISGFAFMTA